MPDVSTGAVTPPPRGSRPGASGGNLPKLLTNFIGRDRELAQAKRLLESSYLVTFTGPGDSGKTRLCIALAAEVAADYPDGVFFVPLAPVREQGGGAVDDRPEHGGVGRQGPASDGAPG